MIDLLADPEKPDTVKVFNLLKVLDARANAKGSAAPYLLSIEGFFVYWTLKEAEVEGAQEIGRSADAAFHEFPCWRQSSDQEREIRRVLHKQLVPRVGVERSTETVDLILDLLRRSGV